MRKDAAEGERRSDPGTGTRWRIPGARTGAVEAAPGRGAGPAEGLPGPRTGPEEGPPGPRTSPEGRTRGGGGWWRGAGARGLALTVLCFAVCLALGLQQWTVVKLGGFDLGIFDQGVRGYAHFGLPRSPIKNVHHGFPPGFSLLGDHFSPILALLAPLYRLWDDPRTLLVVQAALFACGVPIVRRVADRCFAGSSPRTRRYAADLAGLVHALAWPLLTASRRGFHEVAFAVPLLLLMFERGLARRHRGVLLCAALLCCTKEDLGFVVGVYGVVLAVRGRRARDRATTATGAALALLGPAASLAAIGWVLPAMGGVPGYYWSYDRLGPDAGAAVAHVAAHPWLPLTVAADPPVKLALVAWLFGTLLLLPLGSATAWCALPLIAERVLSDNPNHWPVLYHYDAFVWPVLLVAAVETAGRLHRGERRRRRERPERRAVRRWAPAAAVLCLAAALPTGLAGLVSPGAWTPSPRARALADAAARVPSGAFIAADNNVAPRLTARARVVIADPVPRGADYVLLRTDELTYPFDSTAGQRAHVALLLAHGYQRIWQRDGVVLLHRTGPVQAVPGVRPPGAPARPLRERPPARGGWNIFHG
ncbi:MULTISPECIES: DUF2079 domain-containing protein [Streptomycetaceae]|uniref:DUF2079 domain-containing protein n=1 Tax=Streptomycetaceae TaxID=2062 RepID=UPI001E36B9E3|nr:DUF2079 domain-containing protein [Streptantibioticus cattleyicolor]